MKDEPSLIRLARETGSQTPPQPVDLGQRVRELRRARDWTLEQAATHAGLARSTVTPAYLAASSSGNTATRVCV